MKYIKIQKITLTIILLIVTLTLFAFSLKNKQIKNVTLRNVLTINQYVGKCIACDINDDLCLPFKIYIDPNATSPTAIVEAYDNLNGVYYTNCGGTYTYSGGIGIVSGFNVTVNGVLYQYSGTLTYP